MEKKKTTTTIIVRESLAWAIAMPLLTILYAILGVTVGKAAHVSETLIILIGIFIFMVYFGTVLGVLLTGILSRMDEKDKNAKTVSLKITENKGYLGIKFLEKDEKVFRYPYYGANIAHVLDSSGGVYSMVLKENECDMRPDLDDFPYGMMHSLDIDDARDMVAALVLNSFFATPKDAARHLKKCVDSLPELEITDEARSYLLSLAN